MSSKGQEFLKHLRQQAAAKYEPPFVVRGKETLAFVRRDDMSRMNSNSNSNPKPSGLGAG